MSYISIFPILGYQKEKKKYFSTLISIFVYVGEWSSTPHSQLIWLQSMKVTAILMQRLQDFVSNNNKTFYLGPAGPRYSSLFPVAPAIIVSLLILLSFPVLPPPDITDKYLHSGPVTLTFQNFISPRKTNKHIPQFISVLDIQARHFCHSLPPPHPPD